MTNKIDTRLAIFLFPLLLIAIAIMLKLDKYVRLNIMTEVPWLCLAEVIVLFFIGVILGWLYARNGINSETTSKDKHNRSKK